jgi:hypothetical protein
LFLLLLLLLVVVVYGGDGSGGYINVVIVVDVIAVVAGDVVGSIRINVCVIIFFSSCMTVLAQLTDSRKYRSLCRCT